MSRRRDLEADLRISGEIRGILRTLENMARLEVSRLSRFIEAQHRVVASIEAAAADFRAFHPALFVAEDFRDVFLLVGSERGFCGDFNTSLLRTFEAFIQADEARARHAGLVMVGARLRTKAGEAFPQSAFVASASVADEIGEVLTRVADAVNQTKGGGTASLRLTVFYRHYQDEGVRVSVLYPFDEPASVRQPFADPPDLQLDPPVFARQLLEQYLFARLHELLYSSLLSESQTRVEHLESAVQRLERKETELQRKRNVLRQEEITEEIEVIMLSADMTG